MQRPYYETLEHFASGLRGKISPNHHFTRRWSSAARVSYLLTRS